MFNNSSKLLFTFTLILGSLISVSASSWFTAWMGLEINLLSFIPMMSNSTMNSTEASLKYFLIQALASAVLLFGFISMSIKINSLELMHMESIILISLIMKTGAAPFHFWFPNMVEGLNWMNIMLLLTWQKLAPLVLMSYLMNKHIFMMSIILSLMFGTFGGLNQISLRKIMAYSSITHLGWMISALLISSLSWMIYYTIYFIMTVNLILMFKLFNIFYMNQMYSLFMKSKMWKFMLYLNFLSLGGLPPFLGFMPKWLVINSLCDYNNNMLLVILLITTLISLFYYLRLCYSAFMFNNYEMTWLFNTYFNKLEQITIMTLSFLNIFGLMIMSLIYMWI